MARRKFVPTLKIHDLPRSVTSFSRAYEFSNFIDDFFDDSAALRAAGPRHHSKSAIHFAALHDRDKRRCLFARELFW